MMRSMFGLLMMLGFLTTPVQAQVPPTPFTIVVLPDTQKLTAYDRPGARRDMLNAQTRWIVQQRAARNIVFVSHVGDIVDHGGAERVEWAYVDAALDRLDGVVPYAVVGGNLSSAPSGAETGICSRRTVGWHCIRAARADAGRQPGCAVPWAGASW